MTMLDKAARAAYELSHPGKLAWDEMDESYTTKAKFRTLASAVLEAIREPDEETNMVGWVAHATTYNFGATFAAMIDHIINQGVKK